MGLFSLTKRFTDSFFDNLSNNAIDNAIKQGEKQGNSKKYTDLKNKIQQDKDELDELLSRIEKL